MFDRPMKQRNIAAAVALLLVAAGYGYMTAGLPERSLPDTPPPAFLPWINTVLLAAMAGLLLLRSLGPTSEPVQKQEESRASLPAGAFLVLFVIFIAALPYTGFLLASMPFFGLMMLLFGERNPLKVALGSVGTPLLLFAVFRYGFNVLLPQGALERLIG